jgi:ethanolamine utilization protein EutQ (cupin superfamily)
MTNVLKPSQRPDRTNPFGPARIEHRTADSGLEQLGTYVMTFDRDGESEAWTLQYEETAYIAEGDAWIVDIGAREENVVRGEVGDIIVLKRGATVRYGGSAGTRLLLSIAPVNWRDDAD